MTPTTPSPFFSRRRMLQSGGAAALLASPARWVLAADNGNNNADITGQLARYMASARARPLPAEIAVACKQRILDAFTAMVSGSRLRPGVLAVAYARKLGGAAEATVIGTRYRTTDVNAALANAMCAHADETDDFHLVSNAHPGSTAVPAALAVGEREGRNGEDFMRAVALGYDMGCRLMLALGPANVKNAHRTGPALSAAFAALGAASSLAQLDETEMRYALSYTAQQMAGLGSWTRDPDHIEKAFDFAAMGTMDAVMAVRMVQSGMTGVSDILDGHDNPFEAFSAKPKPEEMLKGLGTDFYCTETAIKKLPVGYPLQSPLDAFLTLRRDNQLTPENVRSIVVKLPPDGFDIVNNSPMSDINCQHNIGLALLKGVIRFEDTHNPALMKDPKIMAERAKVSVVSDPSIADPVATRAARVEVTMTDGRTVSNFVKFPPGTKQNPLSTEDVSQKARDLMGPVLGSRRTGQLVALINRMETVQDVRQLRELIAS